jgi:hypothetical protein
MRSVVLSFTLVTVLGIAPAFAQPGYSQDQYQDQGQYQNQGANIPPGELPAPPQHVPTVHHPTNIGPQTTHSRISPALPQPPVGPNADATEYLRAAIYALRHHRGGEAQAALANAETYLLNRSVPYGQVNQPDQSPAVQTIEQALNALGARDYERSIDLAQQALPLAQQQEAAMRNPGMGPAMGMNQPGMGPSGMGTPSYGYGIPPQGRGYGYGPPPNGGYGMNQGQPGMGLGYNQAGAQPGMGAGYAPPAGQPGSGYGYNGPNTGSGYNGSGAQPPMR